MYLLPGKERKRREQEEVTIIQNAESWIVPGRFKVRECKDGTPCIRSPRPGKTYREVYLRLSKLVYVDKEEKIQFGERESHNEVITSSIRYRGSGEYES